jgi:uncharacterized protein (DUF934 family)
MAVVNLILGQTPVAERDTWVRLAEGEIPAVGAKVIVPFARFKADHAALLAGAAAVAVEIGGADRVEDLAPWVPQLPLIVLKFGVFKDGRLFTSARLLRERFGFRGDLRATGDFLPDQAIFLVRSGVNSLEIDEKFSLVTLARVFKAYSVRYQRALDPQPVIVDQRLQGNGA